jgi:hypothetical protein
MKDPKDIAALLLMVPFTVFISALVWNFVEHLFACAV